MDLFRSQVLLPFPTPGSGTLWVAGESSRDRRVSCLPRWTVCPTRSPSLGPNRSTCRGECSWSGPLVTPPGRCHRGPLTNGPGRIPPYCVCSGGADTVTGGAPKPLRLGPSPAPPVGPFRPAPLFAVRFAVVGVPSLRGGVVVVGGGGVFAVPGCVACGRVAPSSGPAVVVRGVWCVVCGVRWWCVGGVVGGVWCGWSLATPGGGSCVLLPATPGWVSLPVVVGGPRHSWLGSAGGGGVWCVAVVCWLLVPRHSWRRFLCATPRHSWLGFAAGGGGWSLATPGWGPLAAVVCGVWRWCVGCWSLATPGGGSCVLLPATPGWVSLPAVVRGVRCVVCGVWRAAVACVVGLWLVWLVPRHSWRRFLCATPRHSWLGFAAGGGGRSPPLLAGVRWRRWCVVCGGGVLVVGPSPLLAEVPVCYSPPLLAGFRCRRWCVVCGVWCAACGVRRWRVWWVCGWCGWSLATPGGGSCVLLPATPGWVSLPVVVGGPRHSWLGSAGGGGVWCVAVVCWLLVPRHSWRRFLCATPRHSWLGFAAGGGAWCAVCGVRRVACGGGVCGGFVAGVVGPSPLLAEVPVCYSPPLLAGFRCRWWWAVPATPGWGPLAAVVCGVWRWCVGC